MAHGVAVGWQLGTFHEDRTDLQGGRDARSFWSVLVFIVWNRFGVFLIIIFFFKVEKKGNV